MGEHLKCECLLLYFVLHAVHCMYRAFLLCIFHYFVMLQMPNDESIKSKRNCQI